MMAKISGKAMAAAISKNELGLIQLGLEYAEEKGLTAAHRLVMSPVRIIVANGAVTIEHFLDVVLDEKAHGSQPRVLEKRAVCSLTEVGSA